MTDIGGPQRCGVGIRGVSIVIDSFVWFGLFIVATLSVAVATGQLETTVNGADATLSGSAGTAAFGLWLAFGIGYHTLLEWRFGKTLGKYLVGIRAVEDDGSPLSLRSSIVRNVFRLVDFLPIWYLVGIVGIYLSDGNKRIGDQFGGTAVVR
ncbi:RDD family protein [Halorientalis brevis]|uniref:RDD family protein n=1 Tax=Halorientalis brevis TaxID=1126241 RepID=A0ABD6CFL8_9EURY|nr:RDD family protein [Halorientalis brevis]